MSPERAKLATPDIRPIEFNIEFGQLRWMPPETPLTLQSPKG